MMDENIHKVDPRSIHTDQRKQDYDVMLGTEIYG